MRRLTALTSLAILAALMLVVAIVPMVRSQGVVTQFNALHVEDSLATATPVFQVNNTGTSNIVELRDSATPVANFPDGGGFNLTVGNATFDTDVTVDDTLNVDDTDSALTGAQTITPTGTYYQMSPATVITVTLGAGTDGDLLIMHNLVTTNVVIIDTGATAGGGNITLGQDDNAGFIYGDGVWVELFSPDNS